jgi:hypothetical protein
MSKRKNRRLNLRRQRPYFLSSDVSAVTWRYPKNTCTNCGLEQQFGMLVEEGGRKLCPPCYITFSQERKKVERSFKRNGKLPRML